MAKMWQALGAAPDDIWALFGFLDINSQFELLSAFFA